MKKLMLIIPFIINQYYLVKAQNNKEQLFPEIKAQTLKNREVTIPEDLTQPVNIVILVFEQQAQLQVDTWAKFILADLEPLPNVSYHEVPLLNLIFKPMSWQVDRWMRDGIPEQYHDNTATAYGNRSAIFRQLGISDRSNCYVYILDQNGIIKYHAEGAVKPVTKQDFFSTVQSMLALD